MQNRFIVPLLGIGLIVTGCGRTTVATVEAPVEAAATEAAAPGEPFQFPNDDGGVLLARSLSPAEPKRALEEASPAPQPFPGPSNPALPSTPLAAAQATLPTIPAEAIVHNFKPHLVTDESSFNPREELSLPQAVSFPVPSPARLASRDVNKPIPLPPLARQTPDRLPLEDPTGEASRKAVVSAATPQRSRPAPYARVKLAESYEDRAGVRLPVPPPEGINPATTATPRTPGK